MHTWKASFRLPAIIICFASVLGLVAACAEVEFEPTSTPWTNFCELYEIVSDPDYQHPIAQLKKGKEKPPFKDSDIPDGVLRQVLDRNLLRFETYPNFQGVGIGLIDARDGHGVIYDDLFNKDFIFGIELSIYPLTDPTTLPPALRIPDCIEGFPVVIIEDFFELTDEN